VLAMAEEVVGLHHKLITTINPKLRASELFTLSDQSGELIARSSRVLEPF
jgi:4-hydroxy-2,2'-bipyrrole-5-carbaldehyde O-methyltransferase